MRNKNEKTHKMFVQKDVETIGTTTTTTTTYTYTKPKIEIEKHLILCRAENCVTAFSYNTEIDIFYVLEKQN